MATTERRVLGGALVGAVAALAAVLFLAPAAGGAAAPAPSSHDRVTSRTPAAAELVALSRTVRFAVAVEPALAVPGRH